MESDNSKSLQSASESTSTPGNDRQLTPKNRLFLQLICDGKSTVDAYKQAGYKGDDHAAYEMRSYLGKELERVLAARGLDRANLMSALKELIDLPINDVQKSMGVSVKQRLAILKEWAKILPNDTRDDRPKITPFILNLNASITPSSASEAPNVVDATVEEPNEP